MIKYERLLWKIQGDMLKNLLTLLNKGDIGTARWQLEKLQGFGLLQDANRNAIKKNMDKIIAETEKAIQKRAMEKIIGTNKEATIPYMINNKDMERTLKLFERTVYGKLENLYQGMLKGMGQKYIEIVNVATAKQALGYSGRKAMDEIVQNWIGKGLPLIQDRGGRQWTAEAYAQTLVRSTSNEVAFQAQMEYCEENGEDLVEVSSHLGARPLCEADQGLVYSLSGTSTKYPPFSSTSYGEPAGLFGVNCRHTMAPFRDGMEKTWQPYGKRENRKVYEESQEQRKLEREIRRAKMEGQKAKILEKQEVLKSFLKDTGRRREVAREQIGGING